MRNLKYSTCIHNALVHIQKNYFDSKQVIVFSRTTILNLNVRKDMYFKRKARLLD